MPFAGVDTVRLLTAGMKVARENNTLIANNIANVDTPNFNPTELDFQATLRGVLAGQGGIQLRKTHPQHLEATANRSQFEAIATGSKNDYNKVDLDDQMAKLSENTGRYSTYASLLIKQFDQVKNTLTSLR